MPAFSDHLYSGKNRTENPTEIVIDNQKVIGLYKAPGRKERPYVILYTEIGGVD
jgi:hypothetical protein